MKKITLLLMCLIASFAFSQDLLLGFEDAESGGLDGGPFGNANALQVNIVTDGGTNGTKVAEFIANTGGTIWQGINLNLTTNVALGGTEQTMTIDVKSATAITFLVKVNDGGDEAAAAVTHNGDNTWQTLSFTFDTVLDGKAAMANGIYNGFVIHAYWAPGATTFGEVTADTRTFYVDNISGPANTDTCSNGMMDGDETGVDCGGSCPNACPMPPSTAAPLPPNRPVADVVSIFSDAYSDIGVAAWGPDWGPSSARINDGTADGNAVKIIDMLGGKVFAGIDFSANKFDASGFTHFHVDYWVSSAIPAGLVFNTKLSNHDETAGSGETSAIQDTQAVSMMGQWVSLDLLLDNFVAASDPANLDRADIAQIVITLARADGNEPVEVFFDNMYFHKNTVLSNDEFSKNTFKAYPNPTQDSWTLKGDSQIQNIRVIDILGKEVMRLSPNNEEAMINGTGLNSGIYFAQIETLLGVDSVKLIKQ